MWLDLDSLFADFRRIEPFVTQLVEGIRPYDVEAVCGPLLGGAFLAQLVAQALGVEFCFTELMPNESQALYATRYRLPRAFMDRVRGKRLAIVDDVMSAGSALRGTYAELNKSDALPVVAGALLVLGTTGADFFAQQRIPVEAVARKDYALWSPGDCPLCIAGVPLAER